LNLTPLDYEQACVDLSEKKQSEIQAELAQDVNSIKRVSIVIENLTDFCD
jgi:hypothetical protein